MLRTSELDYDLPAELIARHPAHPRDRSRLLVYRREADSISHHLFSDLPDLLNSGDLLIANDTRVIPAKLCLRKPTGGTITGLFIAEISSGRWRVMLRTRGRAAPGQRLSPAYGKCSDQLVMTLLQREDPKGQWIVEINDARPALEILAEIGAVPLPPYIEKARSDDRQAVRVEPREAEKRNKPDKSGQPGAYDSGAPHVFPPGAEDVQNYQTIYARQAGALAAPTAGLHFTADVFTRLAARGLDRAWVTLHVGLGTFLPVEATTLDGHPMHHESFSIPRATVERIRRQKAANGRLVLVGTTTVRTLESMAHTILDNTIPAQDFSGSTNLLIQPGYAFELTDVLITNFHLPRSTLLALVGALVGLDRLKDIYRHAIEKRYRFYSFGDAMLILP